MFFALFFLGVPFFLIFRCPSPGSCFFPGFLGQFLLHFASRVLLLNVYDLFLFGVIASFLGILFFFHINNLLSFSSSKDVVIGI